MIIDDEQYRQIYEIEIQIKRLEEQYGENDLRVAEAMERCAQLMRSAKTRAADASAFEAKAQAIRHANGYQNASPGAIDESFWSQSVTVEFQGTMYLPNTYTADTEIGALEVLAYAYENNDQFARASMTKEDVARVWGWIIKHYTGHYPKSLNAISEIAKRFCRQDLGTFANLIDFSVQSNSGPSNETNKPTRKRSQTNTERTEWNTGQSQPGSNRKPQSSGQDLIKEAEQLYNRAFHMLESNSFLQSVEAFSQSLLKTGGSRDKYYGRGYAEFRLGRYDSARKDFDLAILADPNHIDSYRLRATCWRKLGILDRADTDYKHVLAHRPNDAPVLAEYALVLVELNQNDQALAQINDALTCDPENAWYYIVRAHVLSALQQLDSALEETHKAVRLDPDNIVYRVNAICLMLSLSNYPLAEDSMRTLVRKYDAEDVQSGIAKTNEHECELLLMLARVQVEESKPEQALSAINKCIQARQPKEAWDFVERGSIVLRLGQVERAEEDWNRALDLGANELSMLIRQGETYAAIGDKAQALERFQKSAQLLGSQDRPALRKKIEAGLAAAQS